MPTIKELSAAIGVSTQTVRRYVKAELGVKTEPRKPIVLNDEQASIVAAHFADVATPATKEQSVTADEGDHVASLLQRIATLEVDVATYRERVAGLERERQSLLEQLEATHAALEREQMQARGFWGRLGQRLLGDGK